MARCTTEMSMQLGTFSRLGIAVSQEESPGFSRGEDVNTHMMYPKYWLVSGMCSKIAVLSTSAYLMWMH